MYTVDEFGDTRLTSRIVRNSRQRKKWAARSKGGEFQERKSKGEARRVYFCCVSSEIDVQKLYDYLIGSARVAQMGGNINYIVTFSTSSKVEQSMGMSQYHHLHRVI